MKWQGRTQSDNVEVDCLGKRANLSTPEGQAALACQNEVNQIRDNFVKNSKASDPLAVFDNAYSKFGFSNPEPKTAKEPKAESGFLSLISPFIFEKKEETFPQRVQNFSNFLEDYSKTKGKN